MEGACDCPADDPPVSVGAATGLGRSWFLKRSVELFDGSRRCCKIVSVFGLHVSGLSLEQGKSIAWVLMAKSTDLTNPL